MKSWKWLVIILVVALLVVYYILGMDYLERGRENESLASRLIDMEKTLSLIPAPAAGLEKQMEDARADLAAAKSSFAGETDDISIVNSILRTAEKTGVKAIPLSTRPWIEENILNHDYSIFYLTLEVLGDFTHLQNFIEQLENGEPETLVVKKLKVERILAASGNNVTADIELAVYALPLKTE